MSAASDRPLRQRREFRSRWAWGVKKGNDEDNGTCESKGEDNDESNGKGNGEVVSVASDRPL
ncbi:MAG: hypothetical protein J1F20_04800 [Muribaculaceae bacterium]|nr:hypothetical protein [Muribaculaceae bacterium]